MTKHINPSWQMEKDNLHSPEGVRDLRNSLREALTRRYCSLAESMFEWNIADNEKCTDMALMTRDDQPEKTLMMSGQGVWFGIGDQVHFLPFVYDSGINIYGMPMGWSPVPIGNAVSASGARRQVMDMHLDSTNSVIMKDGIFPRSDYDLISRAVSALVDNYLTLNQLTLLAKHPYILRVGNDNVIDARNFYKALAEDYPALFKYNDVETMNQVIENTGTAVDTGIFDVIRQWENLLLEQLGIPGSQKTQKRAQQTVDEVNMGEDMTSLRRHEKLRFRRMACDRVNAMFGTHLTVTSIIDSVQDDAEDAGGTMEESE